MLDVMGFKQMTEPAVWKRGKSYFEDGAATSLSDQGNGHWDAIVSGNDDYEVSIEIQFGHVQQWECDCPYEGDICKHVVATLLSIQEEKDAIPLIIKKKEPKPKGFEQLVDTVSADELRRFLKQYATESKSFKQAFQIFFVEKEPLADKPQYAKMIRQSLHSGMGRHGFIDYNMAPKAFKTVFSLLDKAEGFQNKSNFNGTWQIASAIIEQVSEITGSIDDSDGMIVDSFDSAFELIAALIDDNEVPMPLKEQMFGWFKNEYSNPKYENYGDDLLLDTIIDLTEIVGKADEIIPIIDSKIKKSNSDYELVCLLQNKARLLINSGRIDESVGIINENLQFPEFRKMRLNELLEQQLYDDAIMLIREGIVISEKKSHSGTTFEWKKNLLDIFKKTNQQENYMALLRELFYHSNQEYYPALKSAVGTEKWPDERDKIIDKLKKERYTSSFLYQLYATEQMTGELLQLISQNIDYHLLKTYEKYLKDKYPDEILQMYTIACEKQAGRSNTRSGYHELASMLKYVQKLDGGKAVVTKLLFTFREVYKRRPAMIDELSGLN